MSVMHLITFAHWPEARSFVDHFSPKRHPKFDWLYQYSAGVIIITGEGIHEAISKTTLTLGMFQEISEIYNFGVAGTLTTDILVHSIKEIRTVYAYDQRPMFKSFTLSGDTDLITSGERILNKTAAAPLKSMGSLVDRELWGIAFAAKENRIPLKSFKYISDIAGEIGACEIVKDLADKASGELLEKYLSIAPKTDLPQLNIPGLYLTFSQERLLETLLKKLSIKFEKDQSFWTQSEELNNILQTDISPKDKSRRFIKYLENELDPFSQSLNDKINDLFSSLSIEKISITPSSQMETKDLKVQFQFNSKEDLLFKTTLLKNFNFNNYYELWKGNLDVE